MSAASIYRLRAGIPTAQAALNAALNNAELIDSIDEEVTEILSTKAEKLAADFEEILAELEV